jgi:transposase-like protein
MLRQGRAGIHRTLPVWAEPDDRSPTSHRWTARRKAEVVEAVRSGRLTLKEACRHYALSAEEFAAWERALERRGVGGLMAGRQRGLC